MDCFVTGAEVWDLSCSFFMDESLKPDGPHFKHVFGLGGMDTGYICV